MSWLLVSFTSSSESSGAKPVHGPNCPQNRRKFFNPTSRSSFRSAIRIRKNAGSSVRVVSKYIYLPSCDQLGYPIGMLASSLHCGLARSDSISFSESLVMAAMYCPSGDHRGENSCSAPGSGEKICVCTSTIPIAPDWFRLKITDLPSGDQPGSNPASAPGSNSRVAPPVLEMTYARQFVLPDRPMNTICFPSGDQCGSPTAIEESVSCSRWLPSTLLRHSAPSGTDTYAIHWPSKENVRPSAEIPPR